MIRLILTCALMLASFGQTSPARATCLLCSCTVTAHPISFGSFAPLSNTNLDIASSIDVSCTGITTSLDSLEVKMNAGSSGSFAARRMQSGANLLPYNIYKDPARSMIWGNGTGGYTGLVVTNTLSLLSWNSSVNVYGRIPAAPTSRPGSYVDTILVTVEW